MGDSDKNVELEGIAIIGLACRFPGARSVEEFWLNLRDGIESISFFSEEELKEAGVAPALLANPNYVRAKAVLPEVELFDARFFGFTPREAELTDPQQRLFLECAWEALEGAGYDPERYAGLIGVYAGAGINTYLLTNLYTYYDLLDTVGAFQTSIHNKNDHLTTRVAYKLNLKGPSITVQTACSTSLVAVCLACQSLSNYQCDMALAGGVTINLPQKNGYLYQERGTASPDGHCRAFDAEARGTVDGSGVGAVILKRLEDAVADGDCIYAVIKGSAVNNDGAHKLGYTAPGLDSQAEVIATAQAMAGFKAETISYVETHGTGTPLGDPIEVGALTQAFRLSTEKKNFCAIGSVKTNIGHLDAAAGVAGLIKTALSLKHRLIAPSLHFERPNPEIDFASSPFYVNSRLSEWKTGAIPRRAGVSSFGIGGTNAHVVLEEAPAVESAGPSRKWQVLLLSAKTVTALETAGNKLAQHLERYPDLNLADVAYTLQVGRRGFDHRRAILCRDLADAIASLRNSLPESVSSSHQKPVHRVVTFMFPGQGAQYVNMASELYEEEATFRQEVDLCVELLKPHLGTDLREILYPRAQKFEDAARQLEQTCFTQPALFVIEYALAKLWMQWGLRPGAMIGHSIGEYVSACLAGVFKLEDALALVAVRGRLVQSLPRGAMLALTIPEQEVRTLLSGDLSLAAVNGPSSCVVSGPESAVGPLEAQLTKQGVICRRLPTSHAFHSAMMEPAAGQLTEYISKMRLRTPEIPYISNVTGTWITAEQATDPVYWGRHLRQTVRFADGVNELLKEPNALLLEVGPGRTLKTVTRWHPSLTPDQVVETSLPHPSDKKSSQAFLMGSLGRLWLAGIAIDWERFYARERRQRVFLPTYPFERQRYWLESRPRKNTVSHVSDALQKRSDIADWFYLPVWKESPLCSDTERLLRREGRWLIFADRSGLGERLGQRLRKSGQQVVVVTSDDGFVRQDDQAYRINAGQREDYSALLRELAHEEKFPSSIIHLWSVTLAGEGRASSEEVQESGFYSLLFLAQALGERKSTDGLDLTVVSNDMQSVNGHEALCPEKATVLGPCKVIPREYQNIICRSIDLTLPEPGGWQDDRLLEQLLLEVAAKESEPMIAYRGGRRWVHDFAMRRLESGNGAARLKDGGVYLITGGLGGVGLELADSLARAAHSKLALLGRSAFPDEELWEEWLATHGEQDAISRRILKIRQLKRLGSEVLIIRADVADKQQLKEAVEQTDNELGRINGVIHAAGVAGGGLIQLRSQEATAAVLAPKLLGARNLETVFKDRKLDFLLLLSSLSSIIGRPGQVDYCSANAFLDAFAPYYLARTGTFTVSINWGEWQEVGMAARATIFSRARPGEARALDHPFLEKRIITDTGEELYVTQFNVRKHWVLNEHRLVGTAVIPGVAYIEMVTAALGERAKDKAIELHDVFFMSPLKVRDDQTREVRLTLKPNGQEFNFWVESEAVSDEGNEGGMHRYAVGRVAVVDPEPPKRYVLEELIERCSGREEIATEEAQEDDLGPRWQNVKKALIRKNEVLTRLELPESFVADFEKIKYHPSLMDRAAGRAQEYLVEGVYLPVSYERLRINAPVPRKIYSYARWRESGDRNEETLTFDTVVLNEEGVALVEIEGFNQKRINDAAVAIKTFTSERPAPEESRNGGRQEMSAEEGKEAFQRILAGAVAPQVAVSVRDLHTVIEQADETTQERVLEETSQQSYARQKHPRPCLQTEYIEPGNELERKLSAAWQEMLGIERVGARDNFFELGGDSVQAIQIIAALTQEGIHLTPQQFFQHQTIAELAAVMSETSFEQPVQSADIESSPPAAVYTAQEAESQPFALAELDQDQLARLSMMIEEADALPEPMSGGEEFESPFEPQEVSPNNSQDASCALSQEGYVQGRGIGAKELEAILHHHPAVRDVMVTVQENSHADPRFVAYMVLRKGQGVQAQTAKMQFSLFYFADDRADLSADKYRLYLDGARFADKHGFTAVWTPERHFHAKGGLYPNPSVLSAALATITERVHLRAGSVVLPLHHSLRAAEEWAVVDNLSGGRVGVSFTSGWMPNDFAFFPERYADKRNEMLRGIEEVRRLWRGEALPARDGTGREVKLKILPTPLQPELPIWLTCSGDPEMFMKAGELGFNVLTALLTQSIEEAASKIGLYREALKRHGHDPQAGHVTMMMHTFVGASVDEVLERVRTPLCNYLKSHVELIKTGAKSLNLPLEQDIEEHLETLAAFAFERYYRSASLIGTPETCLPTVERLRAIGVNEVACLIDFGVDVELVTDALLHLDRLKELNGKADESDGRWVRDFLKEQLPDGQPQVDVVVLDSLPDGELNRQALRPPGVLGPQ